MNTGILYFKAATATTQRRILKTTVQPKLICVYVPYETPVTVCGKRIKAGRVQYLIKIRSNSGYDIFSDLD